ncbi:translation factor GUF1, mitochondrial-like [Watersipora subatra]|uniref:translation factor GUF1, mitochondrial-like n=1 Tax=Watersipora subatra TaxID=2589382 RepID=UPI00355B0310
MHFGLAQRCITGLTRWSSSYGSIYHRNKATFVPSNKQTLDLSEYTVERIRNFSIIAHVDHGKSTLADRLLEFTGAVKVDKSNKQLLDRLQVERERGITVKAQTASLFYNYSGSNYLLNLIDTPGHVDFHYEVKRSLAACQGAILLVDANEGVQAQTLANFFLAFELDLPIIPVLNKIDLKVAKPEVVLAQLQSLFDIEPHEVIKVSAKLGTGVDDVLKAIVERIPSPPKASVPSDTSHTPFKALLFDSYFDQYRGAIASIAVKEGQIQTGAKILSLQSGKKYEAQELGIMSPDLTPISTLYEGQVGYVVANMKNAKDALIGDTLCLVDEKVEPLPGFKPAQPMVFAGVFPMDQSEFSALQDAITKLTLNDASVAINVDHSAALGQGWRLGFLGLLHMDVFEQRLRQEFSVDSILTAPNVPYKVKLKPGKHTKTHGKEVITVLNPCHMPPMTMVEEIHEPLVLGTIVTPNDYIGDIISLVMKYRGVQKEQTIIDGSRSMFQVVFPLNEIILTFFDDLKSVTSGYGSFDYEDHGYKIGNLVKLDILVNNVLVEELTTIVHADQAQERGRELCLKLKDNLSREQFEYPIRASVNNRIIARETVKAYRKDVTAKVKSGHDMARKRLLLQRQKEGKAKLRSYGQVRVEKDVFMRVLRK